MPGANPTRWLRSCEPHVFAGPGGPISGRLRFPGTARGRVPEAGVFFTARILRLDLSDLIAEGDVILGESLKTAVIIDVLLNLRDLFGWDALAELFTVEEALQDEVRAALFCVPGLGFEELLAERTAAQVVNGLHLLEEGVPFLEERIKWLRHGTYCIYSDTIS